MKKLILLPCVLLLLTMVARAQHEIVRHTEGADTTTKAPDGKPVDTKHLHNTESNLSIRNSFETADDQASPATASFTLTSGKPNSYLIDLGVLYNYSIYDWDKTTNRKNSLAVGPFAVVDKNTMIGKEQETYRGGGQIEYMWGEKDKLGNVENYVTGTIQYQKNKSDTTNSFIVTAYYSYKNNHGTDESFYINDYNQLGGSRFFFMVKFNAGLEFQDIFQQGTSATGSQMRVLGEAACALAYRHPSENQSTSKKVLWPKMFELTFDYTSRWAFVNTVANEDRYIPLFKPTLNYYPLFNDKLSVGLAYNNGSDPIAGLPKQNFWQLSVQFQK